MSNTKVIVELLSKFAAYEQVQQHASVTDFATWLLKQEKSSDMAQRIKMGTSNEYANQNINQIDSSIGILLGLLNKYARHYAKAALEDLPLNTIDEFGYLAHVSTHAQITKTELINRSHDGKTTGTEIIKRLVKLDLMEELNNPEDKRSKLLRITPNGRQIIGKAYFKMGVVAKQVVGNLTAEEKIMLQHLMSKLEDYHQANEIVILDALKAKN